MPPRKPQFEEEESSSDEESSSPSSTPAIKSRTKFEDEEDDSDVVDDWEADDSEAEREKAKKEAEARAKAAAAAAANKKSKTQRVEEHKAANAARRQTEEDESSEEEDEDEGERRARLKQQQAEAGLRQAQDLFGQVEINKSSKTAPKTLVSVDPSDPSKLADLSALPLFDPNNKTEFEQLRTAIAPLLTSNVKKPHYTLFLQEFMKSIAKDLPSDQIKKLASSMTTLSNEKMKEEKAVEKTGKKTKAAKTKTSLVANRNVATRADTELYDDGMEEDDFM